jgi:glutathione-specific gamma-glutamylcyclotransferase
MTKPARRANVARHLPELLDVVLREWRTDQSDQGSQGDLWIFAYASLIWRPDFEFAEERFATLHGYHRALKMWSRINRGTPELPGLVFGLLPGGSCKGVAYRIPQAHVGTTLPALWEREMPNGGVYDPKWLHCKTALGTIKALAFTLSKRSPSHAGVLTEDHYRQIFLSACGRYGTTRDYAQLTFDKLHALGIHDHALGKLLQLVKS